MDDLISRQAAIDAADYTDYTGLAIEDVKKVTDEVVKEIKKLPSAKPEQRWIPCSEMLPETSGSYLVSGIWASGRVAVGDCEYSSYDGYFNTAWNFDVLAWMPLPKPYEAERKE